MIKSSLLLLALCMLLGAGSVSAQERSQEKATYIPVTRFDPARDPAKDIQDAMVEAKRTGKRVLLDVGGNWCIWCRRLDSLFQANKDLEELLHKGFVVVKVNWSRENKNESVLSHYPKIPGYPHLFILDGNGKLLHSQDTGQLESGNRHDREKVLTFLKKWAP